MHGIIIFDLLVEGGVLVLASPLSIAAPALRSDALRVIQQDSSAERIADSLDKTISHPPTNSPFTYTWGIVGHSLNSVSERTRKITSITLPVFLDAFP